MIRMKRGPNGSGWSSGNGRRYVTRADGVKLTESRAIAEKALGKPLPIRAEVHHVDGDKSNNEPTNLVVCPNKAYHLLLHKRTREYEAAKLVQELLARMMK